MSSSRAESQHSHFGRKRSNTVQSVSISILARSSTSNSQSQTSSSSTVLHPHSTHASHGYGHVQSYPPLKIGDSKVLNLWIHEQKDYSSAITGGVGGGGGGGGGGSGMMAGTGGVLFNWNVWPGVVAGDLIRVQSTGVGGAPGAGSGAGGAGGGGGGGGGGRTSGNGQVGDEKENENEKEDESFLFVVEDDHCTKPQLQISIPKPIADVFGLRNNGEVVLTKVDKETCCADYLEFVFQDQYLGRNDMWRLGEQLVGQCVYKDQEVSFVGTVTAKLQSIYIGGKKVPSAVVTPSTKAIYRSLSAKVTIFIQVCRELWEFAGDGERYNEKIVHSFLPALFAKWKEANTNHTITIILISRVYYDDSEMQGSVKDGARRDERGCWYKDFYKVITDHEVIHEWKPTLVSLKNSFWDFQREILLTHHFRGSSSSGEGSDGTKEVQPPVHLVGRISYAHDGPILEALNSGLNHIETHYIDRSLSVTGATTIIISPGTGYYRVNKELLRLTTARMSDQGIVLNLVLLTKTPLHQSPIFSFEGVEPEAKTEIESKSADPLASDPLWGGDDERNGDLDEDKELKTFWWEPFWIATTFWDKQMDLPFRRDRFIARAKMHEIQMLGLLEADVLSSIEIPYLPEKEIPMDKTFRNLEDHKEQTKLTKDDADKFDMDIFALQTNHTIPPPPTHTNLVLQRSTAEKKIRGSTNVTITTIEESPRRIIKELPDETPAGAIVSGTAALSSSPSRSSIHSVRSTLSKISASATATSNSNSKSSLATKLAPSWLFNPFRSGPSEPQTTQVSASASTSTAPAVTSSTVKPHMISKASGPAVQPVAIRANAGHKGSISRTYDDNTVASHRTSIARRSPINTPPRDEMAINKRRSTGSTLVQSFLSSSPRSWSNPLQPETSKPYSHDSLARRWEHLLPEDTQKHDIKWKALVTPFCLPLTTEYLPTNAELESCYDNYYYDFVVDPKEMRSFLVKPPQVKGTAEEIRRAWALVVMRGMAAVRVAQGFQFILRPSNSKTTQKAHLAEEKTGLRKNRSFITTDEWLPKATGPSDVLQSPYDPVYLSMPNEIHRISFTGDSIQVRRYVRRLLPARSAEYECFIWPKLGGGYTSLATKFASYSLENYGWNRLDMLVAGYEHNFNDSLRYWRTRFIVIPTKESPMVTTGPGGERLNDEEIRILGIEKLAEQFTKLRWQPSDERISHPAPPVRFLPTTLGPAASILDDSLMDQLDQIHAQGPLKKKMKSEREILDMPLSSIAKAMREEDGVPFKNYQWHRTQYPNSFIGFDFVSWLVREFSDVSSRAQATEWGIKLLEQGLFEHCRGQHGFLDGHYFYRLKGEYSVPMTPRGGWFRRYTSEESTMKTSGTLSRNLSISNRKPTRKRIILSQTMAVDIDTNKRSDQAEAVVLHHDIIHNPATVFHFELQWIGTTARCIEEQLRIWNRAIERYGLKLVEAYVTQISDIRLRNSFQACFPIHLALPPPEVPNLELRVPEFTQTAQYFEYAILRKFDFIVDVEAADLYPQHIEVVYSYRRSPYQYSQFVHRSGVAFVQVIGGSEGFLFLANRLMGVGRFGTTMKNKENGLGLADEIRVRLSKFCSDKKALGAFYEEQLGLLGDAPDEPPPLSI